jgi:hypothetical protein
MPPPVVREQEDRVEQLLELKHEVLFVRSRYPNFIPELLDKVLQAIEEELSR